MLKFKCYSCGSNIDKPGALLFSPPDSDKMVLKTHICRVCYATLMKMSLVKKKLKKILDKK
jgi:hypothetical protein